jgi:paraquat-inducible protein B
MSDQPPSPPQPTAVVRSGIVHKRRWSLIWAIPVVTVIIGAWLAWQTLAERGPLITITFETAEGLQANQSHVRHKDVDMGVVQKISLASDLKRVRVTVRMNREAEPLLTNNAQFWVVRPRFFAGSISGLQTLFSGSYIDLLPAAEGGQPQRDFVGLENPPVLQSDVPGRTFLLQANRIGSLNLGSPIMFRDLEVGEVLGWDLGEMAKNITVHAFVREPFDQYVHDNTRFWNASGVKFGLGANGLQVQLESLRAVVLGGIAFDTPDDPNDRTESATDHAFTLYENEDAADSSVFKRSVPFIADFSGSVAGLAAGASVTLHGLKIGEVTSVSLVYDKTRDAVMVPVHFKLEPERIGMLDLPTDGGLDVAMADLVKRGLRVKLDSGNILTGQKQLALEIESTAPPAVMRKEGDAYVLPVVGGSADDVATAATNLVNRLNDFPFESIGKNLDESLAGVNALVNDKQLTESVTELRATLASTQILVNNLNRGLTPAMQQLPAIASGLESSVKHIDKLIGSLDNGYGGDSQFSRDVTRMMVQLSDAARSIRVLADLLARHPEALIRGRTDQGVQ